MAGDETIVDDDELWRYVHPTQILHDRIKNRYRPQSGAFIDRNTGELSVDIARLTSLEVAEAMRPGYSIARFTAAEIRVMGYEVRPNPIHPNNAENLPPNPAHAIITTKLKERDARTLANKDQIWVKLVAPVQ